MPSSSSSGEYFGAGDANAKLARRRTNAGRIVFISSTPVISFRADHLGLRNLDHTPYLWVIRSHENVLASLTLISRLNSFDTYFTFDSRGLPHGFYMPAPYLLSGCQNAIFCQRSLDIAFSALRGSSPDLMRRSPDVYVDTDTVCTCRCPIVPKPFWVQPVSLHSPAKCLTTARPKTVALQRTMHVHTCVCMRAGLPRTECVQVACPLCGRQRNHIKAGIIQGPRTARMKGELERQRVRIT